MSGIFYSAGYRANKIKAYWMNESQDEKSDSDFSRAQIP